MKFGKLTGLLLLTVLLTACTAEQTGPPAYAEPEETTAVCISLEESDPPDTEDIPDTDVPAGTVIPAIWFRRWGMLIWKR